MTRTLLAPLILALNSSVALADSWGFPAESTDEVYEHGKTKIILTTDATEDQRYPAYILRIFNEGALAAQYRNVAFEDLAALKNNTLFVGVSNRGLPGTAIVIFDNKGNLRFEVKHDMGSLDYCVRSVTLVRQWYRPGDPDFQYDEDTDDISFVDCRGERKLLLNHMMGLSRNRSVLENDR